MTSHLLWNEFYSNRHCWKPASVIMWLDNSQLFIIEFMHTSEQQLSCRNDIIKVSHIFRSGVIHCENDHLYANEFSIWYGIETHKHNKILLLSSFLIRLALKYQQDKRNKTKSYKKKISIKWCCIRYKVAARKSATLSIWIFIFIVIARIYG